MIPFLFQLNSTNIAQLLSYPSLAACLRLAITTKSGTPKFFKEQVLEEKGNKQKFSCSNNPKLFKCQIYRLS